MRDYRLYLDDLLEAIELIIKFTDGMTKEQFIADEKTSAAVIQKLEIMGEAARNLPQDFCEEHSDVPWGRMISFRNKLAHGYFSTSLGIVWDTAKNDVIPLHEKIKGLI